ncbi:hypothetical protein DY000_02030094 [Brassica cretica]|uniref:RNase H type-1 domain-containing protein n=1 Tax=Brassica cretica TaxID=69181 RepID=A0ABQ7DWQ2_BRACR|nr:hypothetical protein DY000_02030094 [Brassica cretica]
MDHLFLHCTFASEVWSLVPLRSPFCSSACPSVINAIEDSGRWACLPPTGVSTNILFWIMWALWTTRNQLVFESRHQSPLAVVSRAMAGAQEWKLAQFTSDPPRTIQKGIALALTPTVPQGTILCNSDAAWNQNSESTGLGWIFTPPGSPTLQGSQYQTHVQSALLAEALAIRSALQHAIQLGYTQIWLRSDSLVLVRAITSIAKPKILHGVLSDIETLSSTFSFCVFSFTPRELNGPADHLAKATLCNVNSSRA